MSDDGRVPLGWAVTYKVSADQRRVRMDLPPLRFAGVRKPVSIYMDLNAEAVDAFQRLSRRTPRRVRRDRQRHVAARVVRNE